MRVLLALALAVAASGARGMEVRLLDRHIIMSGGIDGGELAALRDVVSDPASRNADTVILRDSPGGDYWTSQRLAEFIHARGWRTAVSGYCFSGCAIMFLGGRERHFTDDRPALQTQLAFHGTYYVSDDTGRVKGQLNPNTTWAARYWIRRYTDGRISDAMLDRFEQLPKSDFIHFFDAERLPRKGQASVFICPVQKDAGRRCQPIRDTDVYREGIVTSKDLIRSADRRGE